MTKIDLQIDYVINNFDFNKVHQVMVMLGWEWGGINRTPTVGELQEMAEKCLREAYEGNTNISCGGFIASYSKRDRGFMLCFTVDEVVVYED
jgi:hypothetical protein